jgi:hypothetical protein
MAFPRGIPRVERDTANGLERIHNAVENVDEVVLEAEADSVDFELTVDTQPTTVQAIKAHDSFTSISSSRTRRTRWW